MSFICDKCKESTPPRQSCYLQVVETRPREYITTVTKGTEDKTYEKVYKYRGTEIVKEDRICHKCINKNLEKIGVAIIRELDPLHGYIKPKRKSKEESNDQFSIKLPYDVLPSNFFRKLEGMEAWIAHK